MTSLARKRHDPDRRWTGRRTRFAPAQPAPAPARTTADRQYWVIGGEFADTRFERLIDGGSVLGPYADYATAVAAWRRIAVETRSHGHMRYTITAHAVGADGDPADMVDVTPIDALAAGVSRR